MNIARIVLAVALAVPVPAAPATAFRLTAPATVTVGEPFDVTLEAIDANGNVDTGYTGTIDVGIAYPTIPAPRYTFTPADAGVHTFTIGTSRGGQREIVALDADTFSITGKTFVQATCPWFTATAANDGPACPGESVTLTASSSEPAVSYTWQLQPMSPELYGQTVVSPYKSSGEYRLIALHANGCEATATTYVEYAEPPAATITTATIDACEGSPLSIPVALTGTAPFTLTWSDGTTTTANDTTYTRPFAATSETTLALTAVSDAYCSGTASGSVEIRFLPQTHIETQPENRRVRTGQRATLTVEAANATAFQWFEGVTGDEQRPIAGANEPIYVTPPLNRTTRYWVRVTGPCRTEDSITATIEVTPGGIGRRRSVGK